VATGVPPGSTPLDPAGLPARLAAEVVAALRLLPPRGAAPALAPVLFRFTVAEAAGGAAAAPREVRVGVAPDRLDIVDASIAVPGEARHGG
jgi:hypothetical protein